MTHIYIKNTIIRGNPIETRLKLFPTLTISDSLTDIDSITEDMFTLDKYMLWEIECSNESLTTLRPTFRVLRLVEERLVLRFLEERLVLRGFLERRSFYGDNHLGKGTIGITAFNTRISRI